MNAEAGFSKRVHVLIGMAVLSTLFAGTVLAIKFLIGV